MQGVDFIPLRYGVPRFQWNILLIYIAITPKIKTPAIPLRNHYIILSLSSFLTVSNVEYGETCRARKYVIPRRMKNNF
jgi:hypothetical protein|tara:strand:- start:441 stop:674 length:234 start_codon:yes stop_codon:yes gene_type:complete